jgi:hypothetical protein
MMKECIPNSGNNKRSDPLKNERNHAKRLCVSSPRSIYRTIKAKESQSVVKETNYQIPCRDEKSFIIKSFSEGGSTRREQKELEAFRNFWSVINDKHEDADIGSEEDHAIINKEEVVEQEVKKRRMEELYKHRCFCQAQPKLQVKLSLKVELEVFVINPANHPSTPQPTRESLFSNNF